jgi:serine/threonine-protein kinase PpkA
MAAGFTAVLLAAATVLAAGAQEPARPLLMEGKKTLYQRVLTRLGAELREMPEASAPAIKRLPPFSIFYVYGRESADGREWLQLGPSSRGRVSGWVPAEQVVEWKQMLVGLFTKPGNRYPALFFRDRDSLLKVLESDIGPDLAARYRQKIAVGETDSPVVAVEPDSYVDPHKQFYLLPILDHLQADDDFATKLLKVAVVNADVLREPEAEGDAEPRDSLAGFEVAIAFVVDTTRSMGPYIQQTRDAIRRICEKTKTSPWRDRFNFAIVAFRDSVRARPELGYVSRRVAGFEAGPDCASLLREAESMREASISSEGFLEDAFAGVDSAIEDLSWGPYGGRFIVLITDASARSGSDPLSATGLNARELVSKARAQGIAVLTLHLLTEVGGADHERAASQYRALSSWPNLVPFLYQVPAGAERFGAEVEQLANDLIGQLGEEVAEYLARRRGPTRQAADRAREIDRLGHAMRLAYLGSTRGTPAPEVFEAWVAERNAEDRRKVALDIRVLLTKDQLSDLQTALRQIVEAGDLTDLAPQDFFSQVRSLLVVAQRDSAELARAKTLADPVVLGEYLSGLPYHSALTGIDQDSWLAMGAGERQEVIDDIEAKIRLYQDMHDNRDLWIPIDDGRIKGDAVYPVPLSDLP